MPRRVPLAPPLTAALGAFGCFGAVEDAAPGNGLPADPVEAGAAGRVSAGAVAASPEAPPSRRDAGITTAVGGAGGAAARPPGGPPTAGGASGSDAWVPVSADAGPTPRDAADAALTAPSCVCPPGEYFVELVTEDATYRLTEAYGLGLFCDETTVHLANNGCDDAYRLSACAGPDSAPPCLYVAVSLSRGVLLGHFRDSDGNHREMMGALLTLGGDEGQTSLGSFEAAFAVPGGNLQMTGTFAACRTVFPEYACSAL